MAATFNTLENSNTDGRPIRLYEFSRQNQKWRYNTSDRDILRNGFLWQGGRDISVSDQGVKQSGDPTQDDFSVTLSSLTAVAALYQISAPSNQLILRVYDTHTGSNEAVLTWLGTVTDVQRPTPGTAVIVCQNIMMTLSRPGLTLAWTRNCPYALYDDQTCRADPNAHQYGFHVTNLDGINVYLDNVPAPDGTMDGGFLKWQVYQDADGSNKVYETRPIESQVGSVLRLLSGTGGLSVGIGGIMYPGCDRTIATCDSKFQNSPNYGGIPGLPGKSPFDGTPVF